MGQKHDDLTDEEIEIIQRVDNEQQNRKRELYEKMQQEENEKDQRKLSGQQSLSEWKNARDGEVAGRQKVN